MGKGDRKKHKKKKNKSNMKILPKKRNEKKINFEDVKRKNFTDDKVSEQNKKNSNTKMNHSYEIVREKITKKVIDNNKLSFLKEASKYDILDETKIKYMDDKEFSEIFPFASQDDKENNKLKNQKKTEFALAWFKEYKFKQEKDDKDDDVKYIEINKKDLEKIKYFVEVPDVKTLIPYSFILKADIKLQSQYFSKDDDEFYLIQNPCLKDKAFKVPMVRGSGWKGTIAKAGKDLINENIEYFSSYVRVFGTGSDEYRELIDNLEKDKKLTEVLINYLLFELGKKLEKKDIKDIKNKPEEYLKKLNKNLTGNNIKEIPYLNIHKGRVIFYPTFLDKLSLEIINPHNRKTRAGTTPIHYEVVPKDSDGILQIIYIPHDGILTKKEILKEEVEKDIKFLTKCIEKTAENGIGAKTKLGWGRLGMSNKKVCVNENKLKIPEGWEKCLD